MLRDKMTSVSLFGQLFGSGMPQDSVSGSSLMSPTSRALTKTVNPAPTESSGCKRICSLKCRGRTRRFESDLEDVPPADRRPPWVSILAVIRSLEASTLVMVSFLRVVTTGFTTEALVVVPKPQCTEADRRRFCGQYRFGLDLDAQFHIGVLWIVGRDGDQFRQPLTSSRAKV